MVHSSDYNQIYSNYIIVWPTHPCLTLSYREYIALSRFHIILSSIFSFAYTSRFAILSRLSGMRAIARNSEERERFSILNCPDRAESSGEWVEALFVFLSLSRRANISILLLSVPFLCPFSCVSAFSTSRNARRPLMKAILFEKNFWQDLRHQRYIFEIISIILVRLHFPLLSHTYCTALDTILLNLQRERDTILVFLCHLHSSPSLLWSPTKLRAISFPILAFILCSFTPQFGYFQ